MVKQQKVGIDLFIIISLPIYMLGFIILLTGLILGKIDTLNFGLGFGLFLVGVIVSYSGGKSYDAYKNCGF